MDSEKKGLVLASFTISPPKIHLRNGVTLDARYSVQSDRVDIEVCEDGKWHQWGWIGRDTYEEAQAKGLPITYRFDTGSMSIS